MLAAAWAWSMSSAFQIAASTFFAPGWAGERSRKQPGCSRSAGRPRSRGASRPRRRAEVPLPPTRNSNARVVNPSGPRRLQREGDHLAAGGRHPQVAGHAGDAVRTEVGERDAGHAPPVAQVVAGQPVVRARGPRRLDPEDAADDAGGVAYPRERRA